MSASLRSCSRRFSCRSCCTRCAPSRSVAWSIPSSWMILIRIDSLSVVSPATCSTLLRCMESIVLSRSASCAFSSPIVRFSAYSRSATCRTSFDRWASRNSISSRCVLHRALRVACSWYNSRYLVSRDDASVTAALFASSSSERTRSSVDCSVARSDRSAFSCVCTSFTLRSAVDASTRSFISSSSTAARNLSASSCAAVRARLASSASRIRRSFTSRVRSTCSWASFSMTTLRCASRCCISLTARWSSLVVFRRSTEA
mmetsp:Transcript_52726/g.162314  ORF Transcript_52726/g.162314 Transcript_52726/m.162314 type:complete len:259 (-) Transcript_52726:136-912(-)